MKYLVNRQIFDKFYMQSAIIKPCRMYFILCIFRPTDDFHGTCSHLQITFLKILIEEDRDFYFVNFYGLKEHDASAFYI